MCGFKVVTADGDNVGRVQELLLDEGWNVRYLFVNTEDWLVGRAVLLSTANIESVDSINQKLTVTLTREELLRSPWVERRILDRKPLVGSEVAFPSRESSYRSRVVEATARARRPPKPAVRLAITAAAE
jgi:hypothetical protein